MSDGASSGTTESSGSDKSGNRQHGSTKSDRSSPLCPYWHALFYLPPAAQVLEMALSPQIEINLQKFTDR